MPVYIQLRFLLAQALTRIEANPARSDLQLMT